MNNSTNTILTFAAFAAIGLGVWGYFRTQNNSQFMTPVQPGGTLPGGFINTTGAPVWAVWTQFGLEVLNDLGQMLTKIPWGQLPGTNKPGDMDWSNVSEDDINDYYEQNY